MSRHLTAIVEREGEGYVALCPQVDVASQGLIVAEARENLAEALRLFFETASANEIDRGPALDHPPIGSAPLGVRASALGTTAGRHRWLRQRLRFRV